MLSALTKPIYKAALSKGKSKDPSRHILEQMGTLVVLGFGAITEMGPMRSARTSHAHAFSLSRQCRVPGGYVTLELKLFCVVLEGFHT